MATILIAGCGSIGTLLGTELNELGHDVYGIRRSLAPLPFHRISLDLTQPIPAHQLPASIDYVIYTVTPGERSEAAYRQAYWVALNQLIKTLSTQNIKRFFFVSSTAVYHQNDGSWVNELSLTNPTKFNGVAILKAEKLLRQTHFPVTSIRFGGIYGGHRNRLLNKIQAGTDVQSTPIKYTNRIHQDDCVGVLRFFIQEAEQNNAWIEECYLAVDSDPASEEEVYCWLAEQLQAPSPTKVENPSGAQNKRCDNQRLLAAGYQLKYPSFRQGYSAACAVNP